jgi:hypothetical protein
VEWGGAGVAGEAGRIGWIYLRLLGKQKERARHLAVPFYLSLVVVAERSVVMARSHTAVLEICAQNRTDMDLCVLAFRIAPYRSARFGKPRLTFVSEGNPLRRLLLRSKKNSAFMEVSPLDGFARHISRMKLLSSS